ncbi:hypothetical protein B7P43_G15077 [Cryptotermes secundus]|uniref:Uncharacterized protein n=1 Tax=Cryptotermes secundus TaxID=105785 RepID=A0A2J7Q437_9NEOP|nr:hypothetical protein B7P43_G15077 [Cryptotermes secundus]
MCNICIAIEECTWWKSLILNMLSFEIYPYNIHHSVCVINKTDKRFTPGVF